MDNSGYTSIIVGNEVIELRFGIPANRIFFEKLAGIPGIMIDENNMNEYGVAHLLYAGYVNQCMLKDILPTKEFGFFMDFVETGFIDESVEKQLQKVSECYAQSKFTRGLADSIMKGNLKPKRSSKKK